MTSFPQASHLSCIGQGKNINNNNKKKSKYDYKNTIICKTDKSDPTFLPDIFSI
jgi:hypothetical protein